MQDAVTAHPELRLVGRPTFLFSFTSDEFDIYHVNDFMRTRGWRFNGQQYPNALHMAVTRPQTQPEVVPEFAADLADAVAYAKEHADGGAQVGGDLRRRGRRHDRGGGRVHPRRHGRHARRAVHHPGQVSEPETGRPAVWVRRLRRGAGRTARRRWPASPTTSPAGRAACPAGAWAICSPTSPATRTAWCGGWRVPPGASCATSTPAVSNSDAADIEAGAGRPRRRAGGAT